ncbi:MAG: hypothetical protein HYZ53_22645 [Planctomycetes bacterium]|nr:hypothetical protein [Planctomycetota bacterium]
MRAWCACAALLFLASGFARAEDAAPSAAATAGPARVRVGAYIVNIGKLDIATGSYTVDCYLTFEAEKGNLPEGFDFEFVNGRGSIDKLSSEPTKASYRVLANLYTQVDLHKYPLDEHRLPIQLEDKRKGSKELVFVPNDKDAGIDPEITLIGWQLSEWSHKARVHSYGAGEDYSQYCMSVGLQRLKLSATIKLLTPLICFLIVSFISLVISTEKAGDRCAINTGMTIASVMYHVAMINSLPPLGYLTLGDRLAMATYATIGVNLAMSVRILRQIGLKNTETAVKFARHNRMTAPIAGVIAFGLALLPLLWE